MSKQRKPLGATEREISVDQLNTLLVLDDASSKLFWRSRPRAMFDNEFSCRMWNARYAGKEAFTAKNRNGYYFGTIFWRRLLAHRVIWAIRAGAWPDGQIDHINGGVADNSRDNLRLVTHEQNLRNAKLYRNNTSGVPGVEWKRRDKCWVARIGVGRGINKHLGSFGSFDDALAARSAAEKEHQYHPNHGRNTGEAI
jgi:hypothetical protein